MLYTFDESVLLAELERRPTLQELSLKLKKDTSVISRDLKRISEKGPVIEKINGRWVLTEMGQSLALWSKKVAIEQNEILGRDYTLTIATTREFASRILANNFSTFLSSEINYKIITCENGIESAILNGEADFGFDCGRPTDPGIAFKQVIEEEIISVASPSFLKKNKIKAFSDLSEKEFLYYTRLSPVQCKNMDVSKSIVSSNDISVVRSFLLNNTGWATLPYYAVKEEITSKQLSIIDDGEIKGYKFGVWWLRGRDSLKDKVKLAEHWLASQHDLLKV